MKKEKLLQLAHIAAGILTLVFALKNFEVENFSTASYYLLLAIIFMLVAGCYDWIAEKFMKADVAFFLLECTTIIYSGWLYELKGHPYLFYSMVFAGGLYFVFAISSLIGKEKSRNKSRKKTRKRRKRSSLFDEQHVNSKNPIHHSVSTSGIK